MKITTFLSILVIFLISCEKKYDTNTISPMKHNIVINSSLPDSINIEYFKSEIFLDGLLVYTDSLNGEIVLFPIYVSEYPKNIHIKLIYGYFESKIHVKINIQDNDKSLLCHKDSKYNCKGNVEIVELNYLIK